MAESVGDFRYCIGGKSERDKKCAHEKTRFGWRRAEAGFPFAIMVMNSIRWICFC